MDNITLGHPDYEALALKVRRTGYTGTVMLNGNVYEVVNDAGRFIFIPRPDLSHGSLAFGDHSLPKGI
jgi:hypothetical protein